MDIHGLTQKLHKGSIEHKRVEQKAREDATENVDFLIQAVVNS